MHMKKQKIETSSREIIDLRSSPLTNTSIQQKEEKRQYNRQANIQKDI